MKAQTKKTRHKLTLSSDYEDVYIGIVSAEADYKVSLLINRQLGINLKSNDPVSVRVNDTDILFSRFTAFSDFSETSFDLFSNKSKHYTLVSKLPVMDYILRIKSEDRNHPGDKIIMSLRKIKEITGVFLLENKKHQLDQWSLHIIP